MKITTFLLLLVIKMCISAIPPNITIYGPGLQPDKIVLPARYFFVNISVSNLSEPVDTKALSVNIIGKLIDKKTPCRLWTQILYINDSSAIVRYRLYETCYNLIIEIKYKSIPILDSPFFYKGPIIPEDCPCPAKDIEKWFSDFKCKGINKQISDDLSKYDKVKFDKFYDKAVKQFNNSHASSVCHYVIKSNKVYRSCYGQHVGFKMFMDAILLSLLRKVSFPDFEILTNLGDWPLMKSHNQEKFPLFSWCGSHDTDDIVMPTYDITESSLQNMGRVSLDMLSVQGNIGKKWFEKEEMAFWRGRDSNIERLKLIDISRKYPNLINASLTNFFFYANMKEKYGPKVDHVSFFKFFDYKYQLNLDGTVAAYRFPYLLAGDSVVFKQDSIYYEHFYGDLQPWVHYIPIKKNLDDLVEKLKWALENDEKAQEISEAGQSYARNNLMPQDIFCYHAYLFYEWSKKLVSPVDVMKGMEHVPQNDIQGCVCEENIKKDEL